MSTRRAATLCIAASIGIASIASSATLGRAEEAAAKIDFNRDIRPILADKCYACHGPDDKKREADLRLDDEAGVLAQRNPPTIVPGKPEESELYRRIASEDDDERMPPADFRRQLSAEQRSLLKTWIERRTWETHWSYAPLKSAAVPEVQDTANGFLKGPIDHFTLARMRAANFAPNPPADSVTLVRRLYFDLTGLPPTPAEVDAYVKDASPRAYERLVDRLLQSEHYGERLAQYWLDVARYADSNGYHGDNPRTMWLYRDYVIDCFNDNTPFDQFTIEQIAGDLLPEAGRRGRIASAYNRLLQTTQEGGAQAKEYIAKYAADRVRNTANAWLGATMGCVECHNHKYDPFTTKDFYSLAAFFADIEEPAIGGPPHTKILTETQVRQLREFDQQIADLKIRLDTQTPELDAALSKWEDRVRVQAESGGPRLEPWSSVGPFTAGGFDEVHDKAFPPETKVDLAATYSDGLLKWKTRKDWRDGKVQTLVGDNSATYLYRTIETSEATSLEVSLGSDDSIRVWLNGRQLLNKKVVRGVQPDQEKLTLPLQAGANQLLLKVCNATGGYGFYFQLLDSGLPAKITAAVKAGADRRSDEQQTQLAAYYRSIAPELQAAREQLAQVQQQHSTVQNSGVDLVVTKAMAKPRVVRILPRGNWMDESGPEVEPAIPAFLGKLPVDGRRANRLDLAHWLVSPDNPLTARVFANRIWMLLFGAGLSPNVDDLGSQGVAPSHPELLNWLAADFVSSGWDVKRLVKQIVMSSTYRQSSGATAEQMTVDPYNRILARQARWRLDAEMVRDTALSISGLLAEQVGGPSVRPYQPAGYWMHLRFPNRTWQPDSGQNQYRRGLYTWWQRTFLHPSLLAFDAPTREECVARRGRSNTPLQALVLLNDPTYVEAARKFAERIVTEGGKSSEERARFAMRTATAREATDRELAVLTELYRQQLADYAAHEEAAEQLLSSGLAERKVSASAAELAAWADVARAVLNLYETIARY